MIAATTHWQGLHHHSVAVGCAGNKHAKGKVPARRVPGTVSAVSMVRVRWPPGKDEGKDQDRNKAREGTWVQPRHQPAHREKHSEEPAPHELLVEEMYQWEQKT